MRIMHLREVILTREKKIEFLELDNLDTDKIPFNQLNNSDNPRRYHTCR